MCSEIVVLNHGSQARLWRCELAMSALNLALEPIPTRVQPIEDASIWSNTRAHKLIQRIQWCVCAIHSHGMIRSMIFLNSRSLTCYSISTNSFKSFYYLVALYVESTQFSGAVTHGLCMIILLQ